MAQMVSFEEIQRRVQEALKGVLPGQVPSFAKGVVEAPDKGWFKALYYDALTGEQFSFYESPTVVAIALVREGLSRLITAPTIQIPTVEVPTLPSIAIPTVEVPTPPAIKIPTIAFPSVPSIAIPTVQVPSVPAISVPGITLPAAPAISVPSITLPTLPAITVPLPQIDAAPIWNLHGYRYVCGWAVQWACDMLNPQMELLDKVLEKVADGIDMINDGFKKTRDTIVGTVNALTSFRDNAQIALNNYSGTIKKSVDAGLADLKTKSQTALTTFKTNVESSVSGAMGDYSGKVQAALNAYRANIEASVTGAMNDHNQKVQAALNSYQANIQASMTDFLTAYSKKVQDGFNGYRVGIEASVQAALNDFRAKMQVALEAQRAATQASVNAGLSQFIPSLYDMIGLPMPEASPEEAARLREMGDVNGDGIIDKKDMDLIGAAYGTQKGQPGYNEACDLNHDGVIDLSDSVIASGNYGKSVVPTTQLLSPAQLRNVTADGFEFYGLSAGMKLSYVAIGRR